jgi:hypothetical protein
VYYLEGPISMNPHVAIQNIGIVTPGVSAAAEIASQCARAGTGALRIVEDIPPPPGMPSRELRRMARLTRFALYAADAACAGTDAAGNPECGLFVGLTHGSTSYLKEFHDYLFDYGPQMASPTAFSNGVTNAALGAVSKLCGLTGGGVTLVDDESCGMLVLNQAAYALMQGDFRFCCAGAAEEYSQVVADVYARLGWFCGPAPRALPCMDEGTGFSQSEGSCFMVLARSEQQHGACFFEPVDHIDNIGEDIDLVISGAGGGPTDRFERDALVKILSRQATPAGVIFSKCFFGETFSVGALLGGAMAWDIIVNGAAYPHYPLEESIARCAAPAIDYSAIRTVLVLSAGRNGKFAAGIFRRG